MSVTYQAVGWNPLKKRYDLLLTASVLLFLVVFVAVGILLNPAATVPIQLMRATAVGGFLLLHFILIIGPLARLFPSWLPILYNRRHLGVTMFLLAVMHSLLAVLIYHGNTDANPLLSIFTTDAGTRMAAFPFQAFGFGALLILFVMAATSHDFWLANLTAPIWKTLHMGVYLAYGLLLIHVAFGVLQAETAPVYTYLLGGGLALVSGLHLVSGWRQISLDREFRHSPEQDGFVPVCQVRDLVENEPYGAVVSGERVAILRYEGNLVSAVSGVCQHQNGPLAEGRYTYGCLTCPWHGYQYKPDSGKSPEPFTEEIPTFNLRVAGDTIYLHPTPNPAGTCVKPAQLPL